jgi:RNA polymerase sigma-70 factor (ECF subfamily)
VELNIQSNDKEIIDSFFDGNNSAFNIIVLKYQKRVYWTIRKMVVDHDDADDITQEVFIKLHSSLKDFRGESMLFTYLYKMAINYSLNHIKKNKNKMTRETPIDNEFTDKYSDKSESDNEMEITRKNKLIADAILVLPDQQRAVFNMRFYDDMTYDEIAAVLNKSVGGLKANYFHAFKKIQAFLKEKKLKGFID